MFTMIIRNVRGNRQEYRKRKAAMTLRKPLIDEGVVAFAAKADPPEPEILKIEDWPKLDEQKMNEIKTRSACFIDDVNQESPPLGDETVLSDLVTILKADYLGRPAGTAVLKRVTDRADLYYLSAFATAQRSGVVTFKKPPELAVQHIPFLGIGETIVVTLLMELAKGLAGQIGKGIGAQLLCAIFPQGNQIDYKALLEDLAKTVANANTEQTVNEQGGKINGIVNDINTYYIQRKSSAPKEELYNYLLSRHCSLNESLGILRQTEFMKKGIATFVSGAEIDFTLYQEMAIEDPQASDPDQSSNMESLRKAVTDSAAYVADTVHTIITDTVNTRTSQISEPYNDAWSDGNVCKSRYYYFDSETHKRYGPYEQCGKKDHPEARCKKDRDGYFDAIKAAKNTEVTAHMQWMLDSAEQWKVLLGNRWLEGVHAVK